MNNQKKKLYSDKWSKSNTRDIFNEKQKIALNTDLDSQLSEEFVDRMKKRTKLS